MLRRQGRRDPRARRGLALYTKKISTGARDTSCCARVVNLFLPQVPTSYSRNPPVDIPIRTAMESFDPQEYADEVRENNDIAKYVLRSHRIDILRHNYKTCSDNAKRLAYMVLNEPTASETASSSSSSTVVNNGLHFPTSTRRVVKRSVVFAASHGNHLLTAMQTSPGCAHGAHH